MTKFMVPNPIFHFKLCDFESNRESGLNIHMSRKHKTLEQIDGHIEFNDIDTEYDDMDDNFFRKSL